MFLSVLQSVKNSIFKGFRRPNLFNNKKSNTIFYNVIIAWETGLVKREWRGAPFVLRSKTNGLRGEAAQMRSCAAGATARAARVRDFGGDWELCCGRIAVSKRLRRFGGVGEKRVN